MDEARAVIDQLDAIERLDREGAPATVLLGEVRRLLRAAERWAATERHGGVDAALERCRDALASGAERGVPPPGDGAASTEDDPPAAGDVVAHPAGDRTA